ncbi:MAG: Ig-like domain-containing protein, partial [Chloroflexota bacterium]|nr:Ig-like domain-containing protein [Chloroflexota bacterium]
MERLRSFRGAGVTIALLVALVASSQLVDFRRLPDLGPSVFTLTPEGSDVARLSPITVTFAKAPSERAPESLIQLVPSTAGSYAWLSSRTLLFQPDFPGLLRGSTYTVMVPARPDAGLPETVARKFTVTGKLAVQQVIPGNGDTEVPLNAQVLVQFSRSVAPLTTLSSRPNASTAVVTFDPPLHGAGEWLNTSIYRFVPTDLAPTTTYKVNIAKGLTSAVDGVLEQDFRSAFTTIGPAVDSIVPDAGWIYGGPWQEVVVTFNQPMSDSAADGITVRNATTGSGVPGKRSWNDGHTVLTFNPTARMDNDTKYTITVNDGLKGARGGAIARARTSSFTVVGLPSVRQTSPADGDGAAGRFGVSIQFTTPMDPSSLDGKLSVSGFTDKDLEGKVNVFNTGIGANVALEPRTRHTVTLAPGATDQYGQAMGGFRFSFTTGSLPSAVSLALPGYGGAATYSASAEPFLFFQTTNKPAVIFTLYPLTTAEAKSTMHDFGLGNQKWTPSQAATRTWTEKVDAGQDVVRLQKTSLSGGGPLPKGAYLLATDASQFGLASRFVFAVVDTVIVTKLSLDELLAWALDHDTGQPLAGVTVHADGAGLSLADAVTDARGLATFSVPKPVLGLQQERSYYLTIGGERNGVLSTRWQGLSPFQFGLPGEFYAREWVGHIYADRPIYRPGETFFYKGIIRADDDAQYSLPPKDGPFQFVLRNSRGQQLAKTDVRLDDFGSFSGFFDIPADAPTGDYFYGIEQKTTTNPSGGFQIAGNSFLVSEFRTPEFQVEVQTDHPSYVSGDTIAG